VQSLVAVDVISVEGVAALAVRTTVPLLQGLWICVSEGVDLLARAGVVVVAGVDVLLQPLVPLGASGRCPPLNHPMILVQLVLARYLWNRFPLPRPLCLGVVIAILVGVNPPAVGKLTAIGPRMSVILVSGCCLLTR